MENSGWARRIAIPAGVLAIAGMGLTVGCSATKGSPSPTGDPSSSTVDSKTNVKRPGTGDN